MSKRSPYLSRSAAYQRRQRGMTTLIVAILLLAILTIVTFFATSVGLFEQRTATNEYRARMVQQAAESQLAKAVELVKARGRLMDIEGEGRFPGSETYWSECTGNSTAPCSFEPDATRAGQMWYLNAAGKAALFGGTGGIETNKAIGKFTASIDMDALLCQFLELDPELPSVTQNCLRGAEPAGSVAVTLVSHGTIAGENADAVVKEIIAAFHTIPPPPNVPLVASGTITGLGSGQVVASPNAGGWGVPLSMWSNRDVDVTSGGSFKSCHMGEYLSTGTPYLDTASGAILCDNGGNDKCDCSKLDPEKGLISGKPTGSGNQYEGMDVLDVDGDSGALPDVQYYPVADLGTAPPEDDPNFDLDDSLFEYVFGVEVANGGDGILAGTLKDADGNGRDDGADWLEENSIKLTDTTCGTLGPNSTGIYWAPHDVDCDLPSNTKIGSPLDPIVLVIDGTGASFPGQTILYGLVVIRNWSEGASTGSGALSIQAGAVITGSALIEGSVSMNGNVTFVYNDKIMKNIGRAPGFLRWGPVPGSWTDLEFTAATP